MIYEAIFKFQGECPEIDLDAKVDVYKDGKFQYQFEYASLPNIKKTITPILQKFGLAYYHTTLNGVVRCVLFEGHTGEMITAELPIPTGIENPQKVGSIITHYKRYTLAALTGIVTEKDDDANAAVGQEAKEQKDVKKESESSGKAWLNENTVDHTNVVKKLKSGQIDMKKVLQHYRVNKKMQAELEKLIPNQK